MAISDAIKPFINTRYPELAENLRRWLTDQFNRSQQADQTMREVIRALDTTATPLTDAANDAAAAAAGVPLNGFYHTSGAVKVRLT